MMAAGCGLDASGTSDLEEASDAGADVALDDGAVETSRGSSDGQGDDGSEDAGDATTLDAQDGAPFADASDATVEDAHDATVEDARDAAVEDARDATVEDAHDATVEDAHDAAVEDAHDATVEDAHDAATFDANDATVEPDANDATVPDASDATIDDSSVIVPDDATVPDASDAAIAPSTFCAKRVSTFCVDFDDAASLSAAFCNNAPDGSLCFVGATGDASVALDDSVAFSPPASMLATVPAFGAAGLVQAYGARGLPPRLAPFRISIEARVESFGAGAASPLYVILGDFVAGGSPGHAVGVVALADDGGATYSLLLQEYIAGITTTPRLVASGLAADRWHHIALTVDDAPDASDGGASLLVDDAGVAIELQGVTLDASTRTAAVGAPIVFGPTDTWSIRIDNVLADER